jgi:hypothetical protein
MSWFDRNGEGDYPEIYQDFAKPQQHWNADVVERADLHGKSEQHLYPEMYPAQRYHRTIENRYPGGGTSEGDLPGQRAASRRNAKQRKESGGDRPGTAFSFAIHGLDIVGLRCNHRLMKSAEEAWGRSVLRPRRNRGDPVASASMRDKMRGAAP